MELHFEVIRDKETIYAELLQSKSMGHQLAVCYRNGENLIVKICNVKDVTGQDQAVQIILCSGPNDASSEAVVPLENIESIYPIHAFLK
jgi:hypothetical protein